MASYEQSAADVNAAMNAALAKGDISQETADAIAALMTELGTATIANNIGNLDQANAAATLGNANIVMQDASATADVIFTGASPVKAMIVGGGGNSNVVFQTNDDVTVQLQGGQNDSVATGAGDDTITFTGGTATIDTGDGTDTVVLQGRGDVVINPLQAIGQLIVEVQGLIGNASINGGDGFDRVNFTGAREGHEFGFQGGKFWMHSDAQLTMNDGVNVISFDDNNDGTVDDITVLASTQSQAVAASLYQIALGREGIDTGTDALEGINYWTTQFEGVFNQVIAGNGGDAGLTAAEAFLNCPELVARYGNVSDADFVNSLFTNLGAANGTTVTTVGGQTADAYAAQIQSGAMTRAQVACDIALSSEAITILGNDGAQYVIDGWSGDASA